MIFTYVHFIQSCKLELPKSFKCYMNLTDKITIKNIILLTSKSLIKHIHVILTIIFTYFELNFFV